MESSPLSTDPAVAGSPAGSGNGHTDTVGGNSNSTGKHDNATSGDGRGEAPPLSSAPAGDDDTDDGTSSDDGAGPLGHSATHDPSCMGPGQLPTAPPGRDDEGAGPLRRSGLARPIRSTDTSPRSSDSGNTGVGPLKALPGQPPVDSPAAASAVREAVGVDARPGEGISVGGFVFLRNQQFQPALEAPKQPRYWVARVLALLTAQEFRAAAELRGANVNLHALSPVRVCVWTCDVMTSAHLMTLNMCKPRYKACQLHGQA